MSTNHNLISALPMLSPKEEEDINEGLHHLLSTMSHYIIPISHFQKVLSSQIRFLKWFTLKLSVTFLSHSVRNASSNLNLFFFFVVKFAFFCFAHMILVFHFFGFSVFPISSISTDFIPRGTQFNSFQFFLIESIFLIDPGKFEITIKFLKHVI
jgi:hypothetical protein